MMRPAPRLETPVPRQVVSMSWFGLRLVDGRTDRIAAVTRAEAEEGARQVYGDAVEHVWCEERVQ